MDLAKRWMRQITMETNFYRSFILKISRESGGFTLVELLIAMAISGILIAGITSMHINQSNLYKQENERLEMNQNLRATLFLMEKDIRMAGFDRERMDARNFGIVDIRSRDINDVLNANPNKNIYQKIAFTAEDFDGDGNDEMFEYIIFDMDGDNRMDLGRRHYRPGDPVPAPVLVATDVEDIGFAYAFDNNEDGIIDHIDMNADNIYQPWEDANMNGVWDAGEGDLIIWAADLDNDNDLEINLDTDHNGVLNEDDDAAGTLLTNEAQAVPAITADVGLPAIRMVKVFALAKSRHKLMKKLRNRNYGVSNRYCMGKKRMDFNDDFDRSLASVTIKCRNLGLD